MPPITTYRVDHVKYQPMSGFDFPLEFGGRKLERRHDEMGRRLLSIGSRMESLFAAFLTP